MSQFSTFRLNVPDNDPDAYDVEVRVDLDRLSENVGRDITHNDLADLTCPASDDGLSHPYSREFWALIRKMNEDIVTHLRAA